PEGVHFKEKTARQSSDWRGFLTQKGPLLGKKTAFPIFQTSPKVLGRGSTKTGARRNIWFQPLR
ncbi:MAG: hypothetical protein K2P33_02035, partial [Acutalibacter sp.]|nr:hypothetical protein [Acutalibacter sp.]